MYTRKQNSLIITRHYAKKFLQNNNWNKTYALFYIVCYTSTDYLQVTASDYTLQNPYNTTFKTIFIINHI